MKEGVGRGRLGGHPIKDIIEKEYLGKKSGKWWKLFDLVQERLRKIKKDEERLRKIKKD